MIPCHYDGRHDRWQWCRIFEDQWDMLWKSKISNSNFSQGMSNIAEWNSKVCCSLKLCKNLKYMGYVCIKNLKSTRRLLTRDKDMNKCFTLSFTRTWRFTKVFWLKSCRLGLMCKKAWLELFVIFRHCLGYCLTICTETFQLMSNGSKHVGLKQINKTRFVCLSFITRWLTIPYKEYGVA